MSLLISFVSPDSAIIATDTDAAREDGSHFATSKLLALPHLPAVLASRGQLATFQFAFVRACGAGFDSFDELADSMHVLLDDIAETMPAQMIATVPGARRGDHLALVGYSERERRMVGRQWVKADHMPVYQASEFDCLVAPWNADMPAMEHTPANLERIAKAQVDWMRETFPQAACGGRLVVATVTRTGVSISHRLTFETAETIA